MFDRPILLWESLPTWAKWTVGIVVVLLIGSIQMAWGERHFVAGVAESFVALLLHFAIPLAALGAGLFVGIKVIERTQRQLFGWVAGIAVAFVLVAATALLTDNVPGVSWRMQALRDSNCYVDWDGRSNPTVCE